MLIALTEHHFGWPAGDTAGSNPPPTVRGDTQVAIAAPKGTSLPNIEEP